MQGGVTSLSNLVKAFNTLATNIVANTAKAITSISGGTTGLAFTIASEVATMGGVLGTANGGTNGLLPIANGGTNATTVAGAQANLGIAVNTSQALTASSSTLIINYASGAIVDLTLSASVTAITVSNWPVSGTLGRLLLNVSSTGAYTMTGWPGTTIWNSASAPIVTVSGKDSFVLAADDGGTNFRGYILAQAMG